MRSLDGAVGVALLAAVAILGCGSDSEPLTGGMGGVGGAGGEGGHGGDVDVLIPGLSALAQVTTDGRGVPYVVAKTLADALMVEGYLHARDQLARMDIGRKNPAGRVAELVGIGPGDANMRPFNLEAVAERIEATLPSKVRELHQAYADGVNAWIEGNPLPVFYQQRGITEIRPWEVTDSLLAYMGRSEVYNSLYAEEIGYTDLLASYVDELGQAAGEALFFEDMYRTEPMTPASIVPDALGVAPKAARTWQPKAATASKSLSSEAMALVRRKAQEIRENPDAFPEPVRGMSGSNAWVIAGSNTEAGVPILADDPHNVIQSPSTDYEIHMTVTDDPTYGYLKVGGLILPGLIGLEDGYTQDIVWGLTSAYGDTCDVFADRLLRDAEGCSADLCIASEGTLHPVEERDEVYLSMVGGELVDNTEAVAARDPLAVHVLSVPFRSSAPVIDISDMSIIDDPVNGAKEATALTVQCAGLDPGREAIGFVEMLTAGSVDEFIEAVRNITVIRNHYVVADYDGHIGYVNSAEIPLRSDLEAGAFAGPGPFSVRDGSGPANWIRDEERSQGQAIPYRIVPYDEMPQVVDPPGGIIITANNSPLGHSLDNDVFNEPRLSDPNAIYYVEEYFGGAGPRAGLLTEYARDDLADGGKVSMDDMKRWQTSTESIEARLLLPHLLNAWDNAQAPDAPPELAGFAVDDGIIEATARLAAWDFTTPPGIPEGYDSSDVDGVRGEVSSEEAANSVAITIYQSFRTELLERTITDTLASRGLQHRSRLRRARAILRLLGQEPFTGVGASGLDFFAEPASLEAEDRRDVILLTALQTALGILASSTYEDAFELSTNQDDYRWGKLKRFTVQDRLGVTVIPTRAGFEHLSSKLSGMAVEGTWCSPNVTGRVGGERAPEPQGVHAFEARVAQRARLLYSIGDPEAGDDSLIFHGVVAGGGNAADPESPYYAAQLAQWLTGDYYRIPMSEEDRAAAADKVEVFGPE